MKYPYMKNADLKLKNLCKKGINSLYKVEDRNYAFAYLEKELAIIGRQRLTLYGIAEITAYEIADYVRRGHACCHVMRQGGLL